MAYKHVPAAATLAENLEKIRRARAPEPSKAQFGKDIGIGQKRYDRISKF